MKLGSSNFFNFTQFKLFMTSTLIKYSRLHKYSICHRLSDWMYYIICGHWPMLFFPFSLSLQIWLHQGFSQTFQMNGNLFFWIKVEIDVTVAVHQSCDIIWWKTAEILEHCCQCQIWCNGTFANMSAEKLDMDALQLKWWARKRSCLFGETFSSLEGEFPPDMEASTVQIFTKQPGLRGVEILLSNANWKVSANKEQMLFPQILASNADVAAKSADDPIFWYRGRSYFNCNPIFSSTQWNVFRQYHLNLQEKCATHLRCILPVYVAKSTFFLLLCFEVVL